MAWRAARGAPAQAPAARSPSGASTGEPSEPGGSGPTPSQPALGALGCLIISRQGRCLVNCMIQQPPGIVLHYRQLCNMLVAVQSLAGSADGCFLRFNHYSVGLSGRKDFIVAVLAPPNAPAASINLKSQQVAHSFDFYHGRQLSLTARDEELETEKRLSTYTVHDVVPRSFGNSNAAFRSPAAGTEDAATRPEYYKFEEICLYKIISAPQYRRLWLSTLTAIPPVRNTMLLGMRSGGVIYALLDDEPSPPLQLQSNSSRLTWHGGPPIYQNHDLLDCGHGIVWELAQSACRLLIERRRDHLAKRSKRPQENAESDRTKPPGYITLELAGLTPPLKVFVKAVGISVPPNDVCLVVFYQDTMHSEITSPRNGRATREAPVHGSIGRKLRDYSTTISIGNVRRPLAEQRHSGSISYPSMGRHHMTLSLAPTFRRTALSKTRSTTSWRFPLFELFENEKNSLLHACMVAPDAHTSRDRRFSISPAVPAIVHHGMKTASKFIRGAFPFYDDARLLQGLESYHSPQPPPPRTTLANFRRSSYAPGKQPTAHIKMLSTRPAIVPRLQLDGIVQGPADAEGLEIASDVPLSATTISFRSDQPSGNRARSHLPTDGLRSPRHVARSERSRTGHERFQDWKESKRQIKPASVPESLRYSGSAPAREDVSDQWYLTSKRLSNAARGEVNRQPTRQNLESSNIPGSSKFDSALDRSAPAQSARAMDSSARDAGQASSQLPGTSHGVSPAGRVGDPEALLSRAYAVPGAPRLSVPTSASDAGHASAREADPHIGTSNRGRTPSTQHGSPRLLSGGTPYSTPRGSASPRRAVAYAQALSRQLQVSQEILMEHHPPPPVPIGSLRERYRHNLTQP